MTAFDDDRFDTLCSRVLDGEATAEERSELSRWLESTPEARRRYDEFVALESLVFAVGTTDRPGVTAESPVDATLATLAGAGLPLPDEEEEETVFSGASATWIGAAMLAAILWFTPTEPPEPVTDHPDDRQKPVGLEVASLSPGQIAIHQPTEDPSIQFIWIGSSPPSEGNRP